MPHPTPNRLPRLTLMAESFDQMGVRGSGPGAEFFFPVAGSRTEVKFPSRTHPSATVLFFLVLKKPLPRGQASDFSPRRSSFFDVPELQRHECAAGARAAARAGRVDGAARADEARRSESCHPFTRDSPSRDGETGPSRRRTKPRPVRGRAGSRTGDQPWNPAGPFRVQDPRSSQSSAAWVFPMEARAGLLRANRRKHRLLFRRPTMESCRWVHSGFRTHDRRRQSSAASSCVFPMEARAGLLQAGRRP